MPVKTEYFDAALRTVEGLRKKNAELVTEMKRKDEVNQEMADRIVHMNAEMKMLRQELEEARAAKVRISNDELAMVLDRVAYHFGFTEVDIVHDRVTYDVVKCLREAANRLREVASKECS